MRPTDTRARTGAGCLALVVGPVLGIATAAAVGDLARGSWGYCAGTTPGAAAALADHGPLSGFPWTLLGFAAFLAAFPAPFVAVLALSRPARLGVALGAAGLAGLVALAGCAAVDAALTVAPPDGHYRPERCPGGRPPWWPAVVPLLESGPPNGYDSRG
ncbi:hypothetical protein GCM10010441_33170 [Kitasatospora paracochleata]|uniref:Uncharacterized protein n=1 Tax=Kitasatospora paracochleata TaxID=58354 RepID=A0ABT1IPL9_9ACTN|nr:hypothetical protein [Kitasatospora paracochleata]MCP2307071.1 hypothetical protein [Kitasatospora paracochleata]